MKFRIRLGRQTYAGGLARRDRTEWSTNCSHPSRSPGHGIPCAIAGVALAAFTILGVGTVIGGGLALAGAGAFWGIFWGAWAGLMNNAHWNDDDNRWTDVPMEANDVLVVLRPSRHNGQVHRILIRHGALFFLDPEQSEHPIGMRTVA